MKLFPVRTQAPRLPALVLVCLLLCLGAALGFAVCRAVPQQDRQYQRRKPRGLRPYGKQLHLRTHLI